MKNILILAILTLSAIKVWADDSGECGLGLTYYYSDETKTLTISKTGEGKGAMTNYPYREAPWHNYCGKINKIILEEGVLSIGSYAFSGCKASSITIPKSLKYIEGMAFESCRVLEYVYITDLVAWMNIEYNGYLAEPPFEYTIGHKGHIILNGNEITNLIVPEGVVSIGDYAFHNCGYITSVTIPSSVTSIGKMSFWNCDGLTSVHISDLTAWLKMSGHGNSSPLYYAKHLFLNGEEINDLTIPNIFTILTSGLFWGWTGLTSVKIPFGITIIDNLCFSGCKGLTSVNIPNSVTEIHEYGFSGCSAIKEIIIGSNIKRIDQHAFTNCSELLDVYCFSESVPKTKENIFEGSYIEYSILHVPANSINSYKASTPWNQFKKIVPIVATDPQPITETDLSSINGVQIDNDNTIQSVYSVNGRKLNVSDTSVLPKGVYIINGKKRLIK